MSDAYSTAILATSGLVGFWRLGDLSGTTAVDETGTSNGTYTGGYTLGSAGAIVYPDKAVTFNGSTGYVNCGHPAAFNLTAALSLECWFKASALPSGTGNSKWFIGKDHNTTGRGYNFGLRDTGSGVALSFQPGGGNVNGNTVTLDGLWHHAVVTFDGTTYRFYLDGVAGPTATLWPPDSTTTDFCIGQRSYPGFEENWNGPLDEVAVYNVALSAGTVTNHYTIGTTLPIASRRGTSNRAGTRTAA